MQQASGSAETFNVYIKLLTACLVGKSTVTRQLQLLDLLPALPAADLLFSSQVLNS